jgi:streptogramin lyase
LGRLDPRTLEYTEIAPPPGKSKTVQLNAIWAEPGTNKIWFMDVGPNRRWMLYDASTNEFSQYEMTTKLRTGAAGGNTMRNHPNGTVWYNAIGNNTIIRFNPKTGEFSGFAVPSGKGAPRGSASPYGMAIAGDGKIWVALNAVDKLAKVDPATGKIEEFDIPVKGAVPRKGGPDAEGNVWFGLHGAGKVVKVDYKTNAMTVYEPPTKNSGTYCVSVDMKRNLIWVAQHYSDSIARFDPKTGVWTEFPLANAEEDHRRIEVDQKNPNRVWWSGNDSNRMGYIEVLE